MLSNGINVYKKRRYSTWGYKQPLSSIASSPTLAKVAVLFHGDAKGPPDFRRWKITEITFSNVTGDRNSTMPGNMTLMASAMCAAFSFVGATSMKMDFLPIANVRTDALLYDPYVSCCFFRSPRLAPFKQTPSYSLC